MGLMQSSSFAEKMWYPSAMCSNGILGVTISLGLSEPFWMCEESRGHCRFTGHWFIRNVRPLLTNSCSAS
jgi:hypothetical protein